MKDKKAKNSKKDRKRIVEKIDSLAEKPRPSDCKRLQGKKNPPLYRIRSGDYRRKDIYR